MKFVMEILNRIFRMLLDEFIRKGKFKVSCLCVCVCVSPNHFLKSWRMLMEVCVHIKLSESMPHSYVSNSLLLKIKTLQIVRSSEMESQ
jgi:hypothetical protein